MKANLHSTNFAIVYAHIFYIQRAPNCTQEKSTAFIIGTKAKLFKLCKNGLYSTNQSIGFRRAAFKLSNKKL